MLKNSINFVEHFLKSKTNLSDNFSLILALKTVYIRQIESFIAENYHQQLFRCPVHLSIGQESIAVGVCEELNKVDKVVSTHRSHAHYLAKGGDVEKMLAEIMGLSSGCCNGRGGSMHLIDTKVGFMASVPIVGSALPIASGLSYAQKLQNDDEITVCFVGDATFETGQFHESLNFISTNSLPILIVYENNGYSTYSNLVDRQPLNKNLRKIIEGYGISYIHDNGDDVLEVNRIAKNLIQNTRNKVPNFVELDTFRRFEHCGPNLDDDLGYRTKEEIKSYEKRDPIYLILNNKKLIQYEKLIHEFISKLDSYLMSIYLKLQKEKVNIKEIELSDLK